VIAVVPAAEKAAAKKGKTRLARLAVQQNRRLAHRVDAETLSRVELDDGMAVPDPGILGGQRRVAGATDGKWKAAGGDLPAGQPACENF